MRKTARAATKAAFFAAMDRANVTAITASYTFGIGQSTYDRWRAEWKKRKAQTEALNTALDALMEAP